MRIETTVQEMRPKDHSEAWKHRVTKEREQSKVISVGNDAPVKHIKYLIQRYGVTYEQIKDVLPVNP
jgi:hypothetical protein